MTRVAVLQSNYIPWKGYFDIIHRVDVFVFYDDVQYTKNDWRNRNQIKTANGPVWLTIPTGANLEQRICDVPIRQHQWQKKHWRTLEQSYARSKYFDLYRPMLQPFFLDRQWTNLSEANRFLIEAISRHLGINVQFLDSRDFRLEGTKQSRLLQLLRCVGTSHYVSGPSARSYLNESDFKKEGIVLEYMDYSSYPEYPQLHPPFTHRVSVLDLLFNVGPQSARYIWGDDGAAPVDLRAET